MARFLECDPLGQQAAFVARGDGPAVRNQDIEASVLRQYGRANAALAPPERDQEAFLRIICQRDVAHVT